jgi:hypothetical protein
VRWSCASQASRGYGFRPPKDMGSTYRIHHYTNTLRNKYTKFLSWTRRICGNDGDSKLMLPDATQSRGTALQRSQKPHFRGCMHAQCSSAIGTRHCPCKKSIELSRGTASLSFISARRTTRWSIGSPLEGLDLSNPVSG